MRQTKANGHKLGFGKNAIFAPNWNASLYLTLVIPFARGSATKKQCVPSPLTYNTPNLAEI